VQNESSTGSSTSNRVRTVLTIRIENIDFDTQACVLRLKGRNIAENQYVKVKTRIYVLGMLLAQVSHLNIKVILCHMF
jgi:stalled ribosome rescue protein Dom34